jgi:hypothetical protein
MAPVIPYVRQTWTDGSGGGTPISAARLNVLEEGIVDVSYSPAVSVTHNASQSINTSTNTILAFNTERHDQAANAADTMHDIVTNNSRLTCRYAGVYLIQASVEWATNVTGERIVELFLNNTTVIARDRRAAGAVGSIVQGCYKQRLLAVNDFVEVRVFQTSGGALNVTVGADYSPEFMMVRVA